MKKIQILLITIMIAISSSAYAEVAEVYQWKADPGKSQQMLNNMVEAAEIHTELGATVGIYALNVGSQNLVDYVLRFDDNESWGVYKDKIASSEKFQRFWTKVSRNPTGELQMSLTGINLDASTKAADFAGPFVYGVWVWDPSPGYEAQLLQNFARAAEIHEGLGARAEAYSEGFGGTGNYHYVLFFDNWTEMGKFFNSMAQSKELAEFNASLEPGRATLVNSFSGSTISN